MTSNNNKYVHGLVRRRCGPELKDCVSSFENWIAVIKESTLQSVKDGMKNKWGEFKNLGYNLDLQKDQLEFTRRQII